MSANDPTNIWAWVYADADRLQEAGGQKGEIVHNWYAFERYHHKDFAAADHAIGLALAAARAEGELRWELFLRHWRLQLWLDADLNQVLPEAVDLLNLATDERVRDVPQRICAFHDIVDCYAGMDPAGYYEDIVANSEDVLAQLPRRHTCADCARMHLARAAGAAGRTEEAEARLAQVMANIYDKTWSAWATNAGDVYEALGRWEDAAQAFTGALELARKRDVADHYLEGLLGIARARAALHDMRGAERSLSEARHTAKYTGSGALLARMLAVEGYVAEAHGETTIAVEYLTRGSQRYLDLGRYRAAALAALDAAVLAREHQQQEPSEALDIAARAAGLMPPASADVVGRLRAFGREPIRPAREEREPRGMDVATSATLAAERGERQAIENTLAAHVASGNAHGASLALYQLGRWHADYDEPRAALDYFIANAILERAMQLSMDDREDSLNALGRLQEQLPPGAVATALAAAENGPSGALARLMGETPPARWHWLVRAVAAEVAGMPAVEPEADDGRDGFEDWLDRTAAMCALMVRFRDQSDPAMRERFAATLDEMAADIGTQVPEDQGGRELLSLMRGLAALARDGDIERASVSVLPPFNQVIMQIREVAKEPVWRHPEMAPMDFLVEKVAQMAVRSLRIRDEHRRTRLENLAWRLELMNLDLRQPEQLREIVRFVDAVRALVLADGEQVPSIEPPLEEPFAGMLTAVWEAGKAEEVREGEKTTPPGEG